jgi:hypothetical protein
MGEEDEEDNVSKPKGSSNGSISSARPPRRPQHNNQTNLPPLGSRCPRQSRSERQRRNKVAESSAPTVGPSNLNPSAPNFVPGQVSLAPVAVTESGLSADGRGNRNRPRGGRRGKGQQQKKENGEGSASGEASAQVQMQQRKPRNHQNARIKIQPKIIKESEDLMLRMTEALTKCDYDCSICTDSV